jgi:acyl-homoserine-lactone acylase
MSRSLCALLLLSVAAVASPAAAIDTYKAEIRWTPYGVPHVKADDYAGLGFGMGLATTEHTICEFYDRVLTASGTRAFYLGRGTNNANVTSDLFYARHRERVKAWLAGDPATSVDAPSPQARDLIRGFVAGINKYVRDVGGTNGIPDLRCRGQAYVREIDELDYWIFASTYLGVAQMSGQVAAVPPGGTDVCPNTFAMTGVDDGPRPDPQLIGSNAFGFGTEMTKNGKGALLGNPHYPWTGSNRFFRLHLTIPGEINVVGASLINTATVGIGHTANMAWSHTVSTAVRGGFFELTLDPTDPTRYMVDGVSRPMTTTCVAVPVRETNGTFTTASRVFWDTHYGPIVETGTFPWNTTRAFAFRDATAGIRFVDQYIDMGKAQSVQELAAALNKWGGTAFNTTATDSSGEAFYGDVGSIPNVTEAQAAICTPAGNPAQSTWANGTPVMDGSRSECNWANDPGAPPGLVGLASSPHLFRGDYVHQANDSYWLTNPESPLEGYSRVFGNERSTRSLRTRMGLTLAADREAGTDGLGAPLFDFETVKAVMYGNRILSAEMARDDLVTRCTAQPTVVISGNTVDLTAACTALAAWDLRDNLDSRGAHLWRQFVSNGGLVWTVPFDVNDPVHTPRSLSMTSNTVMTALGNAVLTMNNAGIPPNARLGDVQAVTRQGIRIPLHGGSGGAGQFNVIGYGGFGPSGWTTVSTGASWIMAVYFTDDGPVSEGVLTYSQSTNPDSPYSLDQTQLYSNYGWEDLYFTESAVQAATVRNDFVDEVGCDVNYDNYIDRNDVSAVFAARGTTVGGVAVSAGDSRACAARCDLPNCAVAPACGLLGIEAPIALVLAQLLFRRRSRRFGLALALVGVALVMAAPRDASAATISIDPIGPIPAVGGTLTVDVVVDGLAVPPSLGAFDLDLTFDAGVFSVLDVVFGTSLGDPLLDAFSDWSALGGVLDLAEVSLLGQSALDALQAGGTFVLATITFEAIGAGDAVLDLSQADLFDGGGEDPVSVDPVVPVEITVVPEPATGMLVAATLMVLAVARRRGR